jgi:hypothetical protein
MNNCKQKIMKRLLIKELFVMDFLTCLNYNISMKKGQNRVLNKFSQVSGRSVPLIVQISVQSGPLNDPLFLQPRYIDKISANTTIGGA